METILHKSITEAAVMRAVEDSQESLDNPGFCLTCGELADGCEPDMEAGECEYCEAPTVYGAEQILVCGLYHK